MAKSKGLGWSLLRGTKVPFAEARAQLSARMIEPDVSQKERMSLSVQLALAEQGLGNMPASVQLIADCEKYIQNYGSAEERSALLMIRSLHLSAEARYEEAMHIALRALHISEGLDISVLTMRCLISCGRICYRLMIYSEAMDYMNRGLEIARQLQDRRQMMLFMYQLNDIKKELLPAADVLKDSEELLAYKMALGPPDIANAIIAERIIELSIATGDLVKARRHATMAQEVRKQLPDDNTLRPSHYLMLAQLAAAEGDEKSLLQYTDMCIRMEHGGGPLGPIYAYEHRFAYYLAAGQMKLAKKQLDAVAKCATEINSALSTDVLDGCYLKYYKALGDPAKQLLYAEKLYEAKQKRQQQILTQRITHLNAIHELEMSEKEKELIKKELNHKSQELNLSNHHLQQRNQLLNELRECIDSLRNENSKREVVFQTLFKKIDVAFNKEDNEKDLFRAKFDSANADFIHALSRVYPNLSPAECRICALLHSGFSTKEISTLLSTSLRNVETHRLNIRKKLKLKRSDNLQLVLAAVKG